MIAMPPLTTTTQETFLSGITQISLQEMSHKHKGRFRDTSEYAHWHGQAKITNKSPKYQIYEISINHITNYQKLSVIHHLSCIIYHLSSVNCHLSTVISQQSSIISRQYICSQFILAQSYLSLTLKISILSSQLSNDILMRYYDLRNLFWIFWA